MENYKTNKVLTGQETQGRTSRRLFWEILVLKARSACLDYGVFLELANDGKYAILQPTINKFKDTWFKSIERVMNK